MAGRKRTDLTYRKEEKSAEQQEWENPDAALRIFYALRKEVGIEKQAMTC